MKILTLTFILAAGAMPAIEILADDARPPNRIIIANDTCPDVTWGFTETQTRQAFADLIAAHLDEMTRTDGLSPENRDHYNATAFIEVEAFLEIYPQRQGELLRRIREGRLCASPFLCNSLWGFQSVEGALRTFYPARRMEREHGMPIAVAEHIELPSLPWGMASLMAGCGIRLRQFVQCKLSHSKRSSLASIVPSLSSRCPSHPVPGQNTTRTLTAGTQNPVLGSGTSRSITRGASSKVL